MVEPQYHSGRGDLAVDQQHSRQPRVVESSQPGEIEMQLGQTRLMCDDVDSGSDELISVVVVEFTGDGQISGTTENVRLKRCRHDSDATVPGWANLVAHSHLSGQLTRYTAHGCVRRRR